MAYGKIQGMTKTTLYLPDDLRTKLRAEARRRGRPQAELVRDALEAYLRPQRQPLPRFIGIAEDGVIPARDAKEWIRREWGKRP
jgi:plasmid stability protein